MKDTEFIPVLIKRLLCGLQIVRRLRRQAGSLPHLTPIYHRWLSHFVQTDCCEPLVVLLALSMLALAVLLAGFAIWPRGSEDQSASLFSWCRITTLKDGELATQVEELLEGKTMVRELSRQIQDLSRICTRKFEITRSSMGAAFVGILLMALHRIV